MILSHSELANLLIRIPSDFNIKFEEVIQKNLFDDLRDICTNKKIKLVLNEKLKLATITIQLS